MAILSSEECKLECSIFHYFVWQSTKLAATENANKTVAVDEEATSDADLTCEVKSKGRNCDLAAQTGKPASNETVYLDDDTKPPASSSARALIAKYRRLVDIIQKDFSHVAKSDSLSLDSTIPEVYSRWMRHEEPTEDKFSSQRCLESFRDKGTASDGTAESPPSKSVKRRRVDEDAIKGQKISRRTAVECRPDIPDDVKAILLNVSKENSQVKKKVVRLETKLLKTELKLETRQERLKEEAKLKVARLKSKVEREKEKLDAHQQKIKEAKRRKREEKLKAKASSGKKYFRWEDRFDQLVEFFKEHGHCKVPRSYHKNPSLADWVSDQRKYYRKKAPIMTKDCIEKLQSIGFLWNPPSVQKTFEARVEECKAFKAKYGHLNIPHLHDKNEDGSEVNEEQKSLRIWALSIRSQYRRRSEGIHNKLDKIRIKALEDIGFDWGVDSEIPETVAPFDDRFVDRIEQMRKVREICGTCNDKKSILTVFPGNLSLCLWAKTQRRMFVKWQNGETSSLTEERREMLRSIEFDFEPRKHYAAPSKKKVSQGSENLVEESNDIVAEAFYESDGNESAFI